MFISARIISNNFGSMVNQACVSADGSFTVSSRCDQVLITETPAICGDNKVSGNESCDLVN